MFPALSSGLLFVGGTVPKGFVGGGPKADDTENGPLRKRGLRPPEVPKKDGAAEGIELLVCTGGLGVCSAEITPGLARNPLRTKVESKETA